MSDASQPLPFVADGVTGRDLQSDELPDELAPEPQDPPLRPMDAPAVPAGDRHLELRRINERNAEGLAADPDADPRQDDYDIWLGTDDLDNWIPWNRHGNTRTSCTSTATPKHHRKEASWGCIRAASRTGSRDSSTSEIGSPRRIVYPTLSSGCRVRRFAAPEGAEETRHGPGPAVSTPGYALPPLRRCIPSHVAA